MVADAFLQTQPRRHAEAGGEVAPRLLDRFRIERGVAEDGGRRAAGLEFMGHG